jgi:hypothetical protein
MEVPMRDHPKEHDPRRPRSKYVALHWRQGTAAIRVPYHFTPEQIAEAVERDREEREGGER